MSGVTSSADEIAETLTFAWEQPGDKELLKNWRLYWSEVADGPYETEPVVIIPYTGGPGPTFSSPALAKVEGEQGTTVKKFFVLVACGDIPQPTGGTKYECTGNSNEVNYDFWIPVGKFEIPVKFEIKVVE